MLSIKRFLKAIRVINDKDQTKSLELSVSDLASTQTKTVLQSIQTADHTLTLPDVTGTMIANVNNNTNISGVTINLTNTTQNKILMAGPSTGNSLIQDSEFTQSTSATDVVINVTKTLTLSSPSKEIIMDGKALRIPVLTFPIITPPTGNAGDILFNTITQSLWICNNSGTYIEQVSATGTNRTLSNLLAPTAINQSLLPDTNNTRNLGSSSLNYNEGHITTVVATNVNVSNVTVAGPLVVNGGTVLNGNLTVNGTLTTINTTTTNVVDPNVTLNFGGTDSTAEGAGLTIARTGTAGSIVYADALSSKFKVGQLGSESEVITASTTQTITGQKKFDRPLKLTKNTFNFNTSTGVLDINSPIIVPTDVSGTYINNMTATSVGEDILVDSTTKIGYIINLPAAAGVTSITAYLRNGAGPSPNLSFDIFSYAGPGPGILLSTSSSNLIFEFGGVFGPYTFTFPSNLIPSGQVLLVPKINNSSPVYISRVTGTALSTSRFASGMWTFGSALASAIRINTNTVSVITSSPVRTITTTDVLTDLTSATFKIINLSASPINIRHDDAPVGFTPIYIPGLKDYVLASGRSVSFYRDSNYFILDGNVETTKVGIVEAFVGDVSQIPSGYLLCDGRELSTTTYDTLFQKIQTRFKKHNQTITAGNFVIPDLRGAFLRGAMDEVIVTGFVPGMSLPTTLLSQTGTGWSSLKIGDKVFVNAPGSTYYVGYIDPTTNPGQFLIYPTLSNCFAGTSPLSFPTAGAVTVRFSADLTYTSRYGNSSSSLTQTVGSTQIQAVQAHSHISDVGTGGGDATGTSQSFSVTYPNQNTRATETRPDNVAVTYIIKALPDYI